MRSIVGISTVVMVIAGFIVIKNSVIPSCLGVVDGKLAPVPTFQSAVSSQATAARNRVEPLPFKSSLEETRQSILQALEKFERIELHTVDGPYIHALSKNGLFGWRNDIEFYLDENEGLVHFRSVPRLYTFDKDSGRNRYEQIAALY